jgi:hexosaminidase
LGEVTGGSAGAGLFPEQFVHLGGDEVDTSCWTSTPRIVQWMSSMNLTADQTYMYFVATAQKDVIAGGRYPVNWEEVFNHFGSKLDPRTIVHVWLDHATLAKVVAAGYRGLLSNNDVWYLDHLDISWQQFYLNEPHENITDPHQQSLVLGGEVCMWGEVRTERAHTHTCTHARAQRSLSRSPVLSRLS